jgi:hypothetical protein
MAPARTWALALTSVVAVSLVSLLGVVTLGLSVARLQQLTLLLVSFAVGSLLGDVLSTCSRSRVRSARRCWC